ncbi:MAG: hypothetical protein EA398_16840 [Deltaproteobacteria bacterium]|nr:MAG: hypothetical protein EA398_16840 [Deltaproteobacteria bacterium]
MNVRRWKPGLRVAAFALCLLAPAASAEDLRILDPENPASPAPGDDEGQEGVHDLRIHDPENPATPAPGDDAGEEGVDDLRILDPENPATPAPGDDAGEEGEDGLRILDPENPATPAPGEASEGEDLGIFDPENVPTGPERRTGPALSPSPASPSVAPAGSTVWRGEASGRLSSDFRRDHPGEETLESLQSFSLRVRHRTPAGRTVQVEGRLSWWLWGGGPETGSPFRVPDDGVRGEVEADLRSAFLAGRNGGWLWRAGQQTVVWGSSDLLRFGDVLHARDYRRGLTAGGSDARIAAPGLLLTRPWDRTVLQLVWFPFYTADRVPVLGTRYALTRGEPSLLGVAALPGAADLLLDRRAQDAVAGALLATGHPRPTPENGTLGARVTRSGPGWDLSASWIWGWDRTPSLALLPGSGLGGLPGDGLAGGGLSEGLLAELADRLLAEAEGTVDREALASLLEALASGVRGAESGSGAPSSTEVRDAGTALAEAGVDPEAALRALDALLANPDGVGPLWRAEVERRHVLMVDGVVYTGGVGWRGEVVFSPSRTIPVRGFGSVRRPAVEGTFGLSREGSGEGLVLSVEGFVQRWFAESGDEPVALFPELDFGVAGGVQFPLLRRERRTVWEAQLGGLWSVERGVAALTPQATWRPAEGWAVDAGVLVFVDTGPGGVGAALRSASHAFVGWRAAF